MEDISSLISEYIVIIKHVEDFNFTLETKAIENKIEETLDMIDSYLINYFENFKHSLVEYFGTNKIPLLIYIINFDVKECFDSNTSHFSDDKTIQEHTPLPQFLHHQRNYLLIHFIPQYFLEFPFLYEFDLYQHHLNT